MKGRYKKGCNGMSQSESALANSHPTKKRREEREEDAKDKE